MDGTVHMQTSQFAVLSPEQLRQYQEDGYTLVRNLIPLEPLEAVRRVLMDLMNGKQEEWDISHFQFINPEKYRTPLGNMVPGGVQKPAHHTNPVFRAVADHPNLRAAMSQLLGGPVKRFTDQCLIKTSWVKEEQRLQTYYHQDSYYWQIKPQLGCNVWIPLDPVGPGAIALAVLPGSQRGWKLEEHEQYFDEPSMHNAKTLEPFKRHRIPRDRVDFSNEVLFSLNPGDGVFFTNFTWHRAEPNRSGDHKCVYAIAYQLQ